MTGTHPPRVGVVWTKTLPSLCLVLVSRGLVL
jgi:hypothetical protein